MGRIGLIISKLFRPIRRFQERTRDLSRRGHILIRSLRKGWGVSFVGVAFSERRGRAGGRPSPPSAGPIIDHLGGRIVYCVKEMIGLIHHCAWQRSIAVTIVTGGETPAIRSIHPSLDLNIDP